MNFKLKTVFTPTGDQPNAIQSLIKGIKSNEKHQTLLGVTGSGKTFTVANVILELNKPTLVLAHNKTLAAQLYSEFKGFFPENLVEYFVSYYDYYQPEAFIPSSNTYIEKDLNINEEIEKMRLKTTSGHPQPDQLNSSSLISPSIFIFLSSIFFVSAFCRRAFPRSVFRPGLMML